MVLNLNDFQLYLKSKAITLNLVNFWYYLCHLSTLEVAKQSKYMPYSEEAVYQRFLGCALFSVWKLSCVTLLLSITYATVRSSALLPANEDLVGLVFVLFGVAVYLALGKLVKKCFKFGFFHRDYERYKGVEQSLILDIFYRISFVSFLVLILLSGILLLESFPYWYIPVVIAYLFLFALNFMIKYKVDQNNP